MSFETKYRIYIDVKLQKYMFHYTVVEIYLLLFSLYISLVPLKGFISTANDNSNTIISKKHPR